MTENFVFFVYVKCLKTILSLFLLSIHVLLLFHDFVPHSHHENDSSVAHFQHSHSGHDHHHNSNSDGTSGDFVDGFTDHSSDRDFHTHDITYLAVPKSELLLKSVVANVIFSDLWKFTESLPDKIERNDFSPPLKSTLVANNVGLRAPPVLG